jgi:hypothetical protein
VDSGRAKKRAVRAQRAGSPQGTRRSVYAAMRSGTIARMRKAIVCLALTVLASCGDSDMPGGDAGDAGPPLPDDAIAVLEIHALDLWGQPLLDTAVLSVNGEAVATDGWPVVTIPLVEAADYTVELSEDGYEPLTVTVTFDGGEGLDALTASSASTGAGLSVSHDTREIGGRTLPVHAVYLGLRHRWFSAEGRPARRGNEIRLMTSGDEAWAQFAEDAALATERVHMATWWWESSFEVVRDPVTHTTSTIDEREANTILALLDSISAEKRILVGQFLAQDGTLSWLSSDADIRARGETPGDGFEFMGQANETSGMFTFAIPPFLFRDTLIASYPELATLGFDAEAAIESTVPPREVDLTEWPVSIEVPVASYHQKFAVVDGLVAFVGGMNLRRVDWDTDEHLVFEPRRMLIDSSTDDRLAVEAHEQLPDTGPRKDYMTRIEGPLVGDVDALFQMRWSHQLAEGADYSENASDFEVRRDQAEIPGGVQAQLTATLPEPFWEHAILETWWNAIANAEEYIYIEDQYFRIPMLLDLIVERMTEVPALELVVITKPVDEIADPGCEWTYRTDQQLRMLFPDRYHLFQLRSFDIQEVSIAITDETEERFTDIDVHAKMLIVDDVFLSVGSCNKNNRGVVYEGELNVAVYDAAWVSNERRRILELILPPGSVAGDTASEWIGQLESTASANQTVWDNWDAESGDIDLDGAPLPAEYTPSGFVYPMVFRDPSECLIEGVGPDMT